MKPDGEYFRRVVPSPPPLEILQIEAIRTLLEHSSSGSGDQKRVLPIACGGGGIPVSRIPARPTTLQGVEAVIDKDACGAKLATELGADAYLILTDGGGIWENFGKPNAREMAAATPEYLVVKGAGKGFPGSMGPKIQAAIDFVEGSVGNGRENSWAAIGDLKDIEKILNNEEGTVIKMDVEGGGCKGKGVIWRTGKKAPVTPTKQPHKYG